MTPKGTLPMAEPIAPPAPPPSAVRPMTAAEIARHNREVAIQRQQTNTNMFANLGSNNNFLPERGGVKVGKALLPAQQSVFVKAPQTTGDATAPAPAPASEPSVFSKAKPPPPAVAGPSVFSPGAVPESPLRAAPAVLGVMPPGSPTLPVRVDHIRRIATLLGSDVVSAYVSRISPEDRAIVTSLLNAVGLFLPEPVSPEASSGSSE